MAAIFQNGCRKIDATLISAKMHVINHVYTNLWCFQEQIIKKYMYIVVYIHVYCLFRFPVKLLINFSSTFGNMQSKYGGTYRRKAKFLLFHNSFQFLHNSHQESVSLI